MNRWWRLLRHRWLDASDSRRWLGDDQAERLRQCVAAGEALHSGEVRVCVEAALPTSYLWRCRSAADVRAATRERALSWFGRLGVWDTEHNNGVLVYLLLAEHRIELVADRGLSKRVDPRHWDRVVERLGERLRDGQMEDGLLQALDAVHTQLAEHFPSTGGDRPNALPDAVVRA